MKSARCQILVLNSIARLYAHPCRSHFTHPRSLRFNFPRHLSSSSQLQSIDNYAENQLAEADRRKAALRRVLLQYKELHGNMLVPLDFIVPSRSTEWPKEMWGIMLGHVVSSIRAGYSYMSMRDELVDIGFVFILPGSNLDTLRIAFMTYKELHGDMLIQSNFVVPAGDATWPRRTWGLKLGYLTRRIQVGSPLDFLRKDLEMHGYDCNYQSCIGYGEEVIRLALLKYKELCGRISVPVVFRVPKNSKEWPEKMWGMKLGIILSAIRNKPRYRPMLDSLRAKGIEFAPSRSRIFTEDTARLVFGKYIEIHGNFDISHQFVVPSDSDDWPAWMRGIQLGSLVKRIRYGTVLKGMKKELEGLGFSYELPKNKIDRYGENSVILALRTYEKLHGDMLVPTSFVVPRGDKLWPEYLWGKPLGSLVGRIRIGRCYTHMIDEFNKIGFKWYGSATENYDDENVKNALIRYKELNGDMLVPPKFRVPRKNNEWPREMWGVRLGMCVTKIRIGMVHMSLREELTARGFDYEIKE